MLDHVSLRVSNFEKALAFYSAALKPLGYEIIMRFPGAAGLGAGGKPDFWLTASDKPINPTHLAFAADRPAIVAFHAAALAAGGTDHGAPGLRPDYHPNYFGAFALDPDGNNIEAVCHAPVKAARKPAAKKSAAKKSAAKKPAAKAKKAVEKGKAKRGRR